MAGPIDLLIRFGPKIDSFIRFVEKYNNEENNMQLAVIDWLIIVAYFVMTLAVGLAFAGRAGKSAARRFR